MNRYDGTCSRILSYRPPRIAMGLLAIATALQLILPVDWPRLATLPRAAFVAAALGFTIMIRAWWLFRLRETAICPTAESTTLITSDIYRFTRNPMYLGIVAMLLGVALYTGGLAFYAASFGFFLVINFAFCPYEEEKLRREFPLDFAAYAARVRRWM